MTESKNDSYPVGTQVVGYYGWKSHAVLSSKDMEPGGVGLGGNKLFSENEGISSSTALGVLGMPG